MECDSVRIGLNGTRLTILGLKANFTIVKSRKLAIPDLPNKTSACEYSYGSCWVLSPPREASAIQAKTFHTDNVNLPGIQALLPKGYSSPLLALMA